MLTVKKDSYKIGVEEIEGLEQAMRLIMAPVRKAVQEHVYWGDVELSVTEYKSRDGFIPYSHNLGGIQLCEIIPECESGSFKFLTFGEWDGEHYCDGTDKDNCDCSTGTDGEYDARLRIWLKLESVDVTTGKMSFYLVVCGGNGDAPYFRTHSEETYLETEFSCKGLKGLSKAASKHIQKVLKLLK